MLCENIALLRVTRDRRLRRAFPPVTTETFVDKRLYTAKRRRNLNYNKILQCTYNVNTYTGFFSPPPGQYEHNSLGRHCITLLLLLWSSLLLLSSFLLLLLPQSWYIMYDIFSNRREDGLGLSTVIITTAPSIIYTAYYIIYWF